VTLASDIETVLEELRPLVRADGGDLELRAVDEAARRVTMRLNLEGVSCPECVMPPDFLYDIVAGAMRDKLDGLSVVLEDPRQAGG